MEKKLRFKVVSCSSEDPEYPSSELNRVSPNTKGWQSVRYCLYPQELGFELIEGEAVISQLQILSHQSKISSKIEVYIGQGSSYHGAKFIRLGHLRLDSNERSDFQARELKSVHVDNVSGTFVKFIINEPHTNKLNIFNQVGIIAVGMLGTESLSAAPKASAMSRSPAKADHMVSPHNDLSIDLNLDPATAARLRQLAEAKSRAVENEDYLTAKQIKSVEMELKQMGANLAQIDMAKSDAVAVEDYDLAKQLKDKSDILRLEIEEKIRNIHIPGVSLVKPAARQPIPKFAPEEKVVGRQSDDGYNAFDSTPAIGAGAYANDAKATGSGKKTVKVESFHHPAYDDSIGNDYDADNYADDRFDEPSEDRVDPMSRVIKPKGNVYEDVVGGIDDDPNAYRVGGGQSKPVEKFPEGQHPLERVPNFLELPTPESLAGKSRETSDQNGITSLLGEYRSRCLFSKTWVLREAAIIKCTLMLSSDFSQDPPGLASFLPAIAQVIKVGVMDKIQQVLFAAVGLMDELFERLRKTKVTKATAQPLFDPVITQLLEKLSDGNARLREGGRKGLDIITAAAQIGPAAVCGHAIKPLPAKLKNAWRPICARLQLLTDLVRAYDIGSNTGLTLDAILGFPKNNGAYAHSAAEVREDAKRLIVAVYRKAGLPAVEPALALLRPKQREEYEQAFAEADGAGGGPGPQGKKVASNPAPQLSPARVDKHLQHATHAPGGKVPTSAAKAELRMSQDAKEDAPQDFTSCMFCGMHDKTWTENDLDVHYWKDCPLLISCPSCAQIVEIAGLPEHLLDECDEKSQYVPCEVTGLAIRANEFAAWKKSPNCVAAPHNCMYCPLCLASVEDSDDAWLAHLTKGCPRNTRIHAN